MNEREAHSYVLKYQVPCGTYWKERESYELILQNILEVCELDLPVVVCFVLGDSPASEIYMPTFRNTLFHLHRQVGACRFTWFNTCSG